MSLGFITDHPCSKAAIDGTTAIFSCSAINTDDIDFRINGTSASSLDIFNQGFIQGPYEILDLYEIATLRRNLTVNVSSLYNNTEIWCEADGDGVPDKMSSEAMLQVQGNYRYRHERSGMQRQINTASSKSYH